LSSDDLTDVGEQSNDVYQRTGFVIWMEKSEQRPTQRHQPEGDSEVDEEAVASFTPKPQEQESDAVALTVWRKGSNLKRLPNGPQSPARRCIFSRRIIRVDPT
jgi:hypothetical protein